MSRNCYNRSVRQLMTVTKLQRLFRIKRDQRTQTEGPAGKPYGIRANIKMSGIIKELLEYLLPLPNSQLSQASQA
jgi:hypothetical protein